MFWPGMFLCFMDSASRCSEFIGLQQAFFTKPGKLNVVDAKFAVDLQLFLIQAQAASLVPLQAVAFGADAHISMLYEIDACFPPFKGVG